MSECREIPDAETVECYAALRIRLTKLAEVAAVMDAEVESLSCDKASRPVLLIESHFNEVIPCCSGWRLSVMT